MPFGYLEGAVLGVMSAAGRSSTVTDEWFDTILLLL